MADEDDWYPYVWSTPEDGQYTLSTSMPVTSPLYVVVQRVDGLVWNPLADPPALEAIDNAYWPSYGIATTQITPKLFEFTVPWSQTGTGHFVTRLFEQKGEERSPTDPEEKSKFYNITSKQVPREDGIHMSSAFGGVDALRVTNPDDHGLEAVEVMAYKVIGGLKHVRGQATTDRLGRWEMKSPLQPETAHLFEFTKPGFATESRTIVTPALA